MSGSILAVRRGDSIVVLSYPASSNGVDEFDGWFALLPADASDARLGDVLAAALAHAQAAEGFEAPPLRRDRADPLAPAYAAVGATNEASFTRGSSAVSVDTVADQLILGTLRADRGGGFTGTGEEQELPASTEPGRLAALVRAGWGAEPGDARRR